MYLYNRRFCTAIMLFMYFSIISYFLPFLQANMDDITVTCVSTANRQESEMG